MMRFRFATMLTISLIVLFISIAAGAAGGDWEQVRRLVADDAGTQDGYGWSVVIEGNTMMVGTPYHYGITDVETGAVYVYTRADEESDWEFQQKLVPSDGEFGDDFGVTIALQGDTMLVSSLHDSDLGFWSGSVYYFAKENGTWVEKQKILASNGVEKDYFGISIALDGDTAFIGATGTDDPLIDGSVYVFERSGDTWTETQEMSLGRIAGFGALIRLHGDTAFISAPGDGPGFNKHGAVHVYEYNGSTWEQGQMIEPGDGVFQDLFGASIVLDNDMLLIGAPNHTDTQTNDGVIYIFKKDGENWVEQGSFTANNAEAGGRFGAAMSLSGANLIVGAPHTDGLTTAPVPGDAYLFTRSGDTWIEQTAVSANVSGNDSFGLAVAVAGDMFAVGAYNEPNGERSGAVYIYDYVEEVVPDPVELLVNGDFETADTTNSKQPADWTGKNLFKDKLKCNKIKADGTIKIKAHEGKCAYQFKGTPGGFAKLQQKVDTTYAVDDTLTLSAYIQEKSASAGKAGFVKVNYADGSKEKAKLLLSGGTSDGYQYQETSLTITGAVEKVKVQFRYKGAAGKYRVDAVSLMHTPVTPTALLPLPSRPATR